MNTKITLVEYVCKGPRSVEGQELHALTRIVLCALDVRTYVRIHALCAACVRSPQGMRRATRKRSRPDRESTQSGFFGKLGRIMGYNAMVWDHGVGYNATVWYGIGYNAMV